MDSRLTGVCERFLQSRDAVLAVNRTEGMALYPLCAAIYTAAGRTAESARFQSAWEFLKSRTGAFSGFRGSSRILVCAMLDVSGDPEAKFTRMQQMYDALRKELRPTELLPFAACCICDAVAPSERGAVAAQTKEIVRSLRMQWPMLTTAGDVVTAALIAADGRPADEVLAAGAACYRLLREKRVPPGTACKSLAQVLEMTGLPPETGCARASALIAALEAGHRRPGNSCALIGLGPLCTLDAPAAATAQDILDADAWLRGKRGYGALGLPQAQRLLHAEMLVSYARKTSGRCAGTAVGTGAVISLLTAADMAVIESAMFSR